MAAKHGAPTRSSLAHVRTVARSARPYERWKKRLQRLMQPLLSILAADGCSTGGTLRCAATSGRHLAPQNPYREARGRAERHVAPQTKSLPSTERVRGTRPEGRVPVRHSSIKTDTQCTRANQTGREAYVKGVFGERSSCVNRFVFVSALPHSSTPMPTTFQ